MQVHQTQEAFASDEEGAAILQDSARKFSG